MTQEQHEFQTTALGIAVKKGWLLPFLLKKVLPFILDNWDEIFKGKKKPWETAQEVADYRLSFENDCVFPKPAPKNEPGYWDCINSTWSWIPWVVIG